MLRKSLFLSLIVLALAWVGCTSPQHSELQDNRLKVLIDTDMVPGLDDGIAMMMLLNSSETEVLGVTTVTGNTWAQEGLAHAIRQAEICGVQQVPILGGSNYPLREGRLNTIKQEMESSTGESADWLHVATTPIVQDWKAFYQETYHEAPTYAPAQGTAEDFLIQQIKAHPGESTLIAIGPCTNIAKALQKDPEIATQVKEIIYMGGAVYCAGNTTADAEFNTLHDPEAAAICLHAPFPKQTMVSLDVTNLVELDATHYFRLYNACKDEKLKQVLENNYNHALFTQNPDAKSNVWDLISAAIALDPTIVTEFREEYLDVDVTPSSPSYGKTFVAKEQGLQKIRIPLQIDLEKFWQLAETFAK